LRFVNAGLAALALLAKRRPVPPTSGFRQTAPLALKAGLFCSAAIGFVENLADAATASSLVANRSPAERRVTAQDWHHVLTGSPAAAALALPTGGLWAALRGLLPRARTSLLRPIWPYPDALGIAGRTPQAQCHVMDREIGREAISVNGGVALAPLTRRLHRRKTHCSHVSEGHRLGRCWAHFRWPFPLAAAPPWRVAR
jgi:hypothetical protein